MKVTGASSPQIAAARSGTRRVSQTRGRLTTSALTPCRSSASTAAATAASDGHVVEAEDELVWPARAAVSRRRTIGWSSVASSAAIAVAPMSR